MYLIKFVKKKFHLQYACLRWNLHNLTLLNVKNYLLLLSNGFSYHQGKRDLLPRRKKIISPILSMLQIVWIPKEAKIKKKKQCCSGWGAIKTKMSYYREDAIKTKMSNVAEWQGAMGMKMSGCCEDVASFIWRTCQLWWRGEDEEEGDCYGEHIKKADFKVSSFLLLVFI